MKRLLSLFLAGLLWTACGHGAGSGSGRPAGQGDLEKVKLEMTELFSALEMYAHDNSLAYPEDTNGLIPKYLDKLPTDPLTGQPLSYERTDRGYLIKSHGDYGATGAESGYPRMNQDGFFALKAADFPYENGTLSAP